MVCAHSVRGSLCKRLSSTCYGLCARDMTVQADVDPDLEECTARDGGAEVATTSVMARRVEALGTDQGIWSEEVTFN